MLKHEILKHKARIVASRSTVDEEEGELEIGACLQAANTHCVCAC
jgi:hypothetical protein